MRFSQNQKYFFMAFIVAAAFVAHGPHSRSSQSLNNAATADDFTTGFSALALVSPPNNNLSAVYKVSVQDVTIGTATVSISDKDDLYPKNFELKIVNRVGVSPVLSTFSFETKREKKKFTLSAMTQAQNQTSALLHRVDTWSTSGDYLKQENSKDARTLASTTDTSLGKPKEIFWSPETSLLFYKPSSANIIKKVFLPFSEVVKPFSELNAKYDNDGFLNSALIPWKNSAPLEFTRLTMTELTNVRQQLAKGIVDLNWFSDNEGVRGDLSQLKQQASRCSEQASKLTDQINRKLPEIPYLLHRKLYNLSQACHEILESLGSSESSKEKALLSLGKSVQIFASEDRRELPDSLSQNWDWKVLRDDTKKWQWPKLISHLLAQSMSELEQAISIEETQKTALSIRVNVEKLGPRAVVKGILKPRNLTLKTHVEPATDKGMLATSLIQLPKLPVGRFDYLNGQAFARGAFLDLEAVCDFFDGRIGIDLGNSSPEIFRSDIVHGVWDNDTRVQVASEFIRRAAASTDCRQVFIRTPLEIEPFVQTLVQNFKSEVLQTESSFQFSNGGIRKLRLIPGTYDFVASSLVNGQILGREELVVKPDKHGLVNLRFR